MLQPENEKNIFDQIKKMFFQTGPATPGRPGGPGGAMAFPLFCVTKRKKGDKDKKERVSKQKLLKGCQPWWPTILFSVPWSPHFEIHFAGPVTTFVSSNKSLRLKLFNKVAELKENCNLFARCRLS